MVWAGNEPPERYEAWIEADAPGASRVIKDGWEGGWDGKAFSTYDQASNTITVGSYIPGHAVDTPATLRSLIASGQARVTGTTSVDGVPATTLAISGLTGGRAGGAVDGTYDVTQGDAHPLLIQTTTDCGSGPCAETLRFQTYEYLPATPATWRCSTCRPSTPSRRLPDHPRCAPPGAGSAVNAVYAGYWGFTISQVATAVTADRFEIRCGREQGNVMESPTASVTTSVSKSTVRFPAVTVPTS